MTPKEKAKELAIKFTSSTDVVKPNKASIRMALLCVDEVTSQWDYIDTYLADLNGELNPNLKYWHEVKNELSLL